MASPAPTDLLTTPLTALHERLGARMVPFAGYLMPVQYDGLMAEHRHTREVAGLFDVSHMGQAVLTATGDTPVDQLIERLVPGSVQELKPGRLRYSLLLNAEGGIMDDLMITRPAAPVPGTAGGDQLYLVVNAACKDADFAHIAANLEGEAELTPLGDRALIAVQGPQAIEAVAALMPGVDQMVFMQSGNFDWAGETLIVSRSGYTGEDGCEISVPDALAEKLAEALLADLRVKPIGLGARDTLRLEAGLPLYGHDLNEAMSPVEGNLNFAVGKRRRTEGGFPGAERIVRELGEGPARIRVGLALDGRAPAREGAEVLGADGSAIGTVTSGTFSPTLEAPIAMAVIDAGHADVGTEVKIVVRKKELTARVTAMPFVPHTYVRKLS